VLIENFGETKSARKFLGGLKTKLEIFIRNRNIFIPLNNN
jgi:hypothetical protein